MEAAAVGREASCLRFEQLQRDPHGEIRSVLVRLRMPGLNASLRVSAHYATAFDELARFLTELAADWRGWRGERTYESLEHDLQLTATHDGHIQLAVQLQETSAPDGWSAAGTVQLDPGEEMTRAALDVAALLSPSEALRQASAVTPGRPSAARDINPATRILTASTGPPTLLTEGKPTWHKSLRTTCQAPSCRIAHYAASFPARAQRGSELADTDAR